jgi:choline-sulfatase
MPVKPDSRLFTIPVKPDALPPKSGANPQNYKPDMGAQNPLAIAKLASAQGYNVLFITSDEHNAQMTGYERTLGFDTEIQTPNLDKLASEGAYFTHAYAACPLCAPTRASIRTGLYPTEHGVINHNTVMQDQPAWADFFNAQGYYTGIIGKSHDNAPLRKNFGYQYTAKNSGAGVSEALKSPANLPRAVAPPLDKALYDKAANELTNNEGQLRGGVLQDVLQDQDGMVVKLTKEFLDNNKDRKFFLHASLIAPHWPWNSPQKFYNMYDPDKIKMPVNMGPPVDPQPLNIYTREKWENITPQMHRVFRARYMGALSWMDDNIGQILKKLDELGLTEKTLVIYSSDHGEMAGEKGLWFKMVMYEQSVRVPLIIRMPGIITPGMKNETLINHVDFFPTIMGLTGNAEKIPDWLSGNDLSASVLGLAAGPEYTFAHRSTPNKETLPFVLMVRSKQYKLTRYTGNADREYTLFDITKDRYENNNLINNPDFKNISASHKKALDDFMASLRYRGASVSENGG